MAIDQEGVVRYLELLIEKRLSEAEKKLTQLREKNDSSDWTRGYLKALDGLLLSYRTESNTYIHFPAVNMEKRLKALKKDFQQISTNELHADYDRGYFKALVEYLKVVERMEPWDSTHSVEKSESNPSME